MSMLLRIALFAVIVGTLSTQPALYAQSAERQDEVLNELKQIRRLLEKLTAAPVATPQPATMAPSSPPPVAKTVKITDLAGYAMGNPDAPVTIIEFTDLQCPFCRQFHLTTFEKLKKDYVDTGLVRYISRDFPLEAIHASAAAAATASRCAGEQGKFWEMRHYLLLNNGRLNAGLPDTLAQDLKLNTAAFDRCVGSAERFSAEIKNDVASGTALGITGTPSFVIGRSDATGVDGALLVGAQPYAVFDARLKELIGGAR